MKSNRSAVRTAQELAFTVGVLLLAGCGSGAATIAASPTSAAPATTRTSVAPAATPSPAAAQATASTGAASATPAGTSTSSDVSAAVSSALALFEKVPRNPQDPAAGYVWRPGSAEGHLSPQVTARLDALRSAGYFGASGCAEDYLTGTQNGLTAAPTAISAHADGGGTVTVVIRRPATPRPPDLTAVMASRNGHWLATDLASGTGASASIFTSKPHC